MKYFTPLILVLGVLGFVGSASDAYATPADNKKLVVDFYELAFNQHDPAGAMKKYVGETYVQHNPYVADGKKPFIDYFTGHFKKYPRSKTTIKRTVAENDLVVVHTHSQLDEKDPGHAVIDIFRVANGKIAEHWDVGQPVVEKPANTNSMF